MKLLELSRSSASNPDRVVRFRGKNVAVLVDLHSIPPDAV